MRTLFLLLILAIASPCLPAPVATWIPSQPTGLDVVSVPDGQWEACVVANRDAIRLKKGTQPKSNYLYFKLSPDLRAKFGSDAWLIVEFFDNALSHVGVQYNSSQPYTSAKGFLLTATGEWQKAMIYLPNVKFAGLQNGGADFRLSHSGSSLTVSKVEIYAEKPDVQIPLDKERVMKNLKFNPAPKGMFYTFGVNEIDEPSALFYRSLGVTSIESYVTWETCEREAEGKWDWSYWDKQVQVLKDTGLKWVPFLILGPAYSTPDWFRASKEHFPCRCLEHGIDSKIESLWNPNLPKWIERFIAEFAKRYRDSNVIESVLLGIQGDFGEAIYSVTGGGWTFKIPGVYHNHAGYWCDDPYALSDFQKFVERKYKTIQSVNKAWGCSFDSFDKVDFPGRKDELTAFQAKAKSGDPKARRRWLDFIEWYREAMTRWADWWIKITRQYFPTTPIYLCTGGDAEPRHGSNFAEQCRIAAKYDAGVRITNEASDYAANFVITRWVASAAKYYGAYYGFEPAGAEDEKGIVARIYNATASGANQLHDYAGNVTQSQERIDTQRKHLKYLFHVEEPIVPIALWYPNVHMTIHWGEGYFGKAATFRDYTDWDYIDETMLRNGALDRYKLLVILHGRIIETDDARRIADWIKKGGKVLVMDIEKFESVEGTNEPEQVLTQAGITRVNGWNELISELRKALASFGYPVYDLKKDGIFGTQISNNKFLFLNTTKAESQIEIENRGKKSKAFLPAGTITEVDL
ncbi:MAG: family 14 glycosylhydrolase [Armatimonadota bacterium]|nr:family 14 glycosylhydrolase [Armatimonadota bacterium]